MDKVIESTHTTKTNHCLPFSEVDVPGCYVANESGELFRVPEESLSTGRSPLIKILGRTPRMLTRISRDPWEPVSKARQLAADADLYVDF